MCSCTGCRATDKLTDAGFAAWPRGNPAGRKAQAEYAAHVRHGMAWGRAPNGNMHHAPEIPAGVWLRDPFPCRGTVRSDGALRIPEGEYKTMAGYIKAFERENGLRAQEKAAKASPRRPPATAPQTRPPTSPRPIGAVARGDDTPTPKRRPGRPELGVHRVSLSLDPATLDRAKRLGGGNVSRGVRIALERVSPSQSA